MNLNENKLEIGIAVSAFALIFGLGQLLKQPVQKAIGEMNISYEMPRPKNSILAAIFSLGDREIDKKYINPFEKNKKQQTPSEDAKNAAIPAKPGQKTAKKPATKNKPGSPSSLPEATDSKVDVTIVGGDPKKPLNATDIAFGNPTGGIVVAAGAGNANNSNPAENGPADLDKMSGSQWRALIAAQPTLENIQKLKAAYLSGEVESAGFYVIVQDLLASNTYDSQKLGIIALEGVYSTTAFSLAARYANQLEEAEASLLDNYLQSYLVSARLNILGAAMKSQDSVVVTTAIELAIRGYQGAKTGTVTVPANDDGRSSRGDGVTSTASNYAQFIPIFKQLSGSADGEVAQLASQALSQIQVSVASL